MFTSTFKNVMVKSKNSIGLVDSARCRMKAIGDKMYLPSRSSSRLTLYLQFEPLKRSPVSTILKCQRNICASETKQIEPAKQKSKSCKSPDSPRRIIGFCHKLSTTACDRRINHNLIASCLCVIQAPYNNSTKFFNYSNHNLHTSCVNSMIERNEPPSNISSTHDGNQTNSEYDIIKAKKLEAQWKLDPRGVKHQSINTCRALYVKWQQTRPRLYRYAPRNGINFDVEYYDTSYLIDNQNRDKDAKVIVLLHGAPGTYKDYSAQIIYFMERGYRVIAPNFPDHSARAHGFRHSTKERYYYLEDFFRAINLTRIHMIVGHSAAVYVLFELLEKSQYLKINAIGLLNNPGYKLPRQLEVTRLRIVNRADKLDNLLLAASCVGYSEHVNLERQYRLIKSKNIPAFIVISDRDKLIPSQYYQMVLDALDVHDDQINCFDEHFTLVNERKNKIDLVQVVKLMSGGHYSFQSHADTINKEMEKFLTTIEGQSN